MLTPARLILRSPAVWLAVAAAAVWGAWEVARPTQPAPTARQQAMIAEVAREANLWAGRLDIPREATAFLTFGRDRFALVSDPVRDALHRTDRFELADFTLWEKALRKVEWDLPMVAGRRDAREAAAARDCTFAVWGRVNELSDISGRARIEVSIEMVEAATGCVIAHRTFEINEQPLASVAVPQEIQPPGGPAGGWPFATRALVWLAAVALLPLIAWPVVRHIVTGESNAAILALLALFVIAGVGAAYGLLAHGMSQWTAGIALAVAFALALAYNWHAMSIIKQAGE